MKNTLFTLAALAFAGASIVSCNKELGNDNEVVPVPSSVKEFTLSVDAVKGLDTKALALSGDALNATWAEGDAVAVCRIIAGDTEHPLSEVIGKLTPSTTGSASTTLSGTIATDGIAEGDWLYLQYPYKVKAADSEGKIWLDCSYAGQDGSLETIAKSFDYATCGIQVEAIDADNLTVSKAEFVNRQSIVKFSPKNADGSAALNVTKFEIIGQAADSFWHDSYYCNAGRLEIVPSAASSELYVAIHAYNGDPVSYALLAVTADNVYEKTTPAAKFVDGKFHNASVKMAPLSYEGFDDDSDWSVIGSISEYDMSWNNDLNMWTNGAGLHVAASVKLKAGDAFKFRKDASWAENLGFGELAVADVVPAYQDGADLTVPADGEYDLYLDTVRGLIAVVPASGAGKVSTVPEVIKWGVVGINNDWVNDIMAEENPAGVWTVKVATEAATTFKWRMNHDFSKGDLGGTLEALGEPFEAVGGGSNISIPEAGRFAIVLDFNATPATITVSKIKSVWSLIGEFSSWTDDVDMVLTDGKWVSPSTRMSGEFKIRYEHDWVNNRGADGTTPFAVTLGEPFAVVQGGQNLVLPGEGDYIVTYDPAAETIVIDEAPAVYSVVGSFDGWTSDYDMTLQSSGLYSVEIGPLDAGEYEFKVRLNHAWDYAWPSSDNYVFNATAAGTLTVNIDPDTKEITTNFVPTAPATKTITVGVISYLISDLGADNWQVRYWGEGITAADANLVATGATSQKSVGSEYWDNAEQTFTMFTAEIPADATGYKVHNGDARWFGEDGTPANPTAYVFNYSGDKALYE